MVFELLVKVGDQVFLSSRFVLEEGSLLPLIMEYAVEDLVLVEASVVLEDFRGVVQIKELLAHIVPLGILDVLNSGSGPLPQLLVKPVIPLRIS